MIKFYGYIKSIVANIADIMKLVGKAVSLINHYIKNTKEYKTSVMDYQTARNIYLINYGKGYASVSKNDDTKAVEIYDLYNDLLEEEQKALKEYFMEHRAEIARKKQKKQEIEFKKSINPERFTELVSYKHENDGFAKKNVDFDIEEVKKGIRKWNDREFNQEEFDKWMEGAKEKEKIYAQHHQGLPPKVEKEDNTN